MNNENDLKIDLDDFAPDADEKKESPKPSQALASNECAEINKKQAKG